MTRSGPHILAFVHKYAGLHNAGAEWYLHTVLRHMQSAGAEVRVLVRDQKRPVVFQGIHTDRAHDIVANVRWSDLVITHLDVTGVASRMARLHHRPIVHIVHNDRQLAHHHVTPDQASLVVFNSQWIADSIDWSGRSIIVTPPVVASDYLVAPGCEVTLVNLSLAKGVAVFERLAELMPDHHFLGVDGGYGLQLRRSRRPNVEYVDNTPDMREVYRRTRVLLMPSAYESWGRVAIEAAVSGIPTIAAPTPGLVEALGGAGIFAPLDRVGRWKRALESLDDPQTYAAASARVRARAAELDPTADLERLRVALWSL